METVSGIITLVQEDRFQLFQEDGTTRLFILSHRAPVGPDDLQRLARLHATVTIRCETAPHLIAAVAHDVTLADRVLENLEAAR